MKVIATGGLNKLFKPYTDAIDFIDDLYIERYNSNLGFRIGYFSMNLPKPKNDELMFLPLGGSGEIGMNFNLY